MPGLDGFAVLEELQKRARDRRDPSCHPHSEAPNATRPHASGVCRGDPRQARQQPVNSPRYSSVSPETQRAFEAESLEGCGLRSTNRCRCGCCLGRNAAVGEQGLHFAAEGFVVAVNSATVNPAGATANASAAARAARTRGRFMSSPPVRVAPSLDGAGSWSRIPSGRNPSSTQSSMLVKRSPCRAAGS